MTAATGVRRAIVKGENVRVIRTMPTRMWINQPAKGQCCHHMHGTAVLAVHEGKGMSTIYPLEGATVSMRVPTDVLSPGWSADWNAPATT